MEDRFCAASDSAALQQKIKELIATGEFEMGGKISEDQLATRFGAGRATIRHALASLAAIGLLDVRPRVGTFVFSLDVEEFDELNTLREVLECAAIRISMESNRRIFLQRMQENLEKASTLTFRSNHHLEYRMLDREFHRLPFVCARNKYLTEAYENIEIKIWTMRSLLTFPDAHYNASLESHRSVVELLTDGQVELACERLQKHIKTSFSPREKNLLRSFDG
ncbi:TPA: GntR family transcriptional regulator [Burkholderia vietnamiensis]|nr:GntR family transcriptional regulator [Burkholderia vietnamiensis]